MPDKKLELMLLAREVLKNSLGTPDQAPTLGLSATDAYTKPTQYNTEMKERRFPTGLEAKGRLFTNPAPDPYRDVETPDLKAAIDIIKRENPHAFQRQKGMHFAPAKPGDIGRMRGAVNAGDFLIDPEQAAHFNTTDNPVNNLVDVIRHEMSHGLGWEDNYVAQPIIEGIYGRRPLDPSGKPRDAQDIDLASHLLHRKPQ